MKKNNWIKLIASIVICELAGIIGSLFTANSVQTWYQTLNRPLLNPPSWVFGPVWATLYILMGISLYIIWNKKKLKGNALYYFIAQLVLNTVWSIVFFGMHNILLAGIVILLLWVSILLTILSFKKINVTSAYLLYPYLAWVTFATYLNLGYLLVN